MNCFALTIVAEKQKRVAVGDRKSHSPQENHWSVLRTAKRKIAQVGDNSEKSHILECFFRNARTYFTTKQPPREPLWVPNDNLWNKPAKEREKLKQKQSSYAA